MNAGNETRRPVRVWCDGCFDLVHYGHANSLRQAKQMGDVLVVGVHNDQDIAKNKGPPVFTEQERYQMVRGIKWVDEVVEGSTYWPTVETLKEYNCDFATHGDDLSIANDGRDPYEALRNAGKLKLYRRTEGVSTTDIVGRMLLLSRSHHNWTDEFPQTHQYFLDKISLDNQAKSPWTRTAQFLPTSNRIMQFSEGKDPQPGDRIIYVCGDFDLLHPGHLDFLKAAKEMGDYLIVGLHTDSVVNRRKGSNYPIMNLHERTLSVLACRYVSEVVIGAPFVVSGELMDQFKIDLVCHGWTSTSGADGASGGGANGAGVEDPYAEAKRRGKFKVIDTGNRLTTAEILRRVIEHRLEFEFRNLKKEKREAVAASTANLTPANLTPSNLAPSNFNEKSI